MIESLIGGIQEICQERKIIQPAWKLTLSYLVMFAPAGVFLLATYGMIRRQEPFFSWYYSFAWWSYIFFANAYLFNRRGRSLLFSSPRLFLILLPLSTTVWLVFELFNFRLQNWHYFSITPQIAQRWPGYAFSFATVLPGLFTTANLLEHFGLFNRTRVTPLGDPLRLYLPFIITGIAFILLPVLWPRYFFPLVWGAFIFLLEPVNHRFGAPSILRDWQNGSLRTFYLLLSAGAVCGLLWELWNFWAGSKWVYTIPFVHWLKIFEMPILGFLGFPPFAVECYVMVNSFFLLKDSIERTYPPARRTWVWALIILIVLLFDILIFAGIDRFTVL